MMRIPVLIVTCFTALLVAGALAQQPVPDAPQPQKKQTAKAPPDPPPPPPAQDDNAFPEDVSKKAAEAASPSKEPNTGPNTGDNNPFPEEESKAAAKAAGKDGSSDEAAPVLDPARSKKDNEVGDFYLKAGDYHGALLRYQDATASDPTNVSAIFGLAESQHMLKKNADAARNYELYLTIVPNGPKAKHALKALKEMQTAK